MSGFEFIVYLNKLWDMVELVVILGYYVFWYNYFIRVGNDIEMGIMGSGSFNI